MTTTNKLLQTLSDTQAKLWRAQAEALEAMNALTQHLTAPVPEARPVKQLRASGIADAVASKLVAEAMARTASTDDPTAAPSTFTSRDVNRVAGRALTQGERISVGKELRKLGWTSAQQRVGDARQLVYSRTNDSNENNNNENEETT